MPRAEAARLQGFKTAFAFPVILDNEVLAVFEFFSTGRHLTDRTSVDAFHKLGKFLGDVFVRKRTQTELQTSEERWRSLLDSPIFGVKLLDENQRFISSNQAYRTMTGYSNEELRQLTPLDISVPGEREFNEALYKELQKGKRQHFEIIKRLRCKNGKLIWINLYVFAVSDRTSGASITIEDSGTGIAPENIDRIFNTFFTTKPHGMGMGLAICRSIVESYDGRLTASPGHRHGAVFQVVLPAGRSGGE